MPEPLPETRALTNWKPRKLDTEGKTEKQTNRILTCRSWAYYVSAGQKKWDGRTETQTNGLSDNVTS